MAVRDKGRAVVQTKAAALERLVVEYVDINSIHKNSYNPNRQSEHDFELLLRSMREDGFTQPIVVQRASRDIVDGEHRWRGAAALGMTEIPVVFVDMTPEQMRIATLRHNRARGSEDIDLSTQVLRDLRALGALDWAQDSLMLDDADLQRLLDDLPVAEALAGDEFSQAWQPGGDDTPARTNSDETGATSITPAALERIRAQEKKAAEATTEQDRMAARRDSQVYRLSLVFEGEEGQIVKRALGDTPAEKVLAMCQAALTTHA